jgi:hypothetical protein
MAVGIEVLITKIFVYFHIYTVRVERLKDCCDFAGQEYKQILGYAKVNWLSLLQTLERTLKISLLLKSFYVRNTVPKSMKQFFETSETELWLSLAHSQASFFHKTIKVIEGDDKCATESALAVKTLLLKLQTLRGEHFIPRMVKKLLTDLVQDVEMTLQRYFRTSKEYYDTALSYF